MYEIRRASPEDTTELRAFLSELELVPPNQTIGNFFVAVEEGRIIAALRLEKNADFSFLSSLGVARDRRGAGLARRLVDEALSGLTIPVYLYTVILKFFEKLRFEITEQPPDLPPREQFGCDKCEPGRCVCMVRFPHDS